MPLGVAVEDLGLCQPGKLNVLLIHIYRRPQNGWRLHFFTDKIIVKYITIMVADRGDPQLKVGSKLDRALPFSLDSEAVDKGESAVNQASSEDVTFYKGGASNSHILSTCHLRLN
jgi:hypothetical protein